MSQDRIKMVSEIYTYLKRIESGIEESLPYSNDSEVHNILSKLKELESKI